MREKSVKFDLVITEARGSGAMENEAVVLVAQAGPSKEVSIALYPCEAPRAAVLLLAAAETMRRERERQKLPPDDLVLRYSAAGAAVATTGEQIRIYLQTPEGASFPLDLTREAAIGLMGALSDVLAS